MAHMGCLYWAQVASKGFPNIAKLKAIAYAEQFANNHFREIAGNTADATVTAGAVFGDGKTVDNLRGHQRRIT